MNKQVFENCTTNITTWIKFFPTFSFGDDGNRCRLPSFLAKHDWAKHQWPHCVFFPGANPSAWTTMMKEWVWLCPHFNFMLVDKPKVEQTGKLLASLGDSEVQSELSTAQKLVWCSESWRWPWCRDWLLETSESGEHHWLQSWFLRKNKVSGSTKQLP